MTFFVGLRGVAPSRALVRSAKCTHAPAGFRGLALSARLSAATPSRYAQIPSTLDEVLVDYPGETSSSVSRPATASPVAAKPVEPVPSPSPFLEGLSGDASNPTATDWSKSYHGLSSQPFSAEIAELLQAPLSPEDIEMKPDGIAYLPEIKYRRILNKAFGPGGWGLAPRSETNVGPKVVSREYALVCLGRLTAVARGEQEYFDPNGIPTATEGCKSNALMRCCKDIGIASELWDPRFLREFKKNHCVEVFVEHVTTKRKRKLWRRKDQKFEYPYKE